ncbi:DNase I-like protein, partial [Gloeophyllum trabeum ATCC 11539]
MRDKRIGILAVQETHLDRNYVADIHELYEKRLKVLNSPDPSRATASAGVAFILNREITNTADITFTEIIPGRAALLTTKWHKSEQFSILNIYAPNDYAQHAPFWSTIQSYWTDNSLPQPTFMMGDFNIVEDQIDRSPPHADPPQATNALRETRLTLNLVDAWRIDHANERTFTYHSHQGRLSRIDRVYTQRQHLPSIRNWEISASVVPSDHALTTFRYAPVNSPYIGDGRWTWPLGLIRDKDLLDKIIEIGAVLQLTLEDPTFMRSDTHNVQRLWQDFKITMTKIAKAHAKLTLARITHKIKALEHDLKHTQNHPDLDTNEDLRINAALLE